ncbi:G-type lectin S-receptor-like serine/threonine-protein kinase At4g27290 [Lotus japonicus]|uniref:G-type lectin S-receptor-like serine/threonine-protein kinase At4g27290 n=1 Tax=Lotus japonicus TaxID=34305 RepID=UPI00258AC4A5|nr:G-type lectin S-receptor-like serine/threonine-protein kinase At4g27290 [Lotus japonicus]
MAILPFMLLVVKLLSLTSQICSVTDKITQYESLPDGATLVSQGGTYELGFFSPGSSTNRYLGIWFRNVSVKTVVWVANRDNPLANKNSGKLSISKEGNLVLLSKNGTAHWSTNQTTKGSSGVIRIAQLLAPGNFVIRDEKEEDSDSEEYLWQSFDYPTDTFLPGMKLGWNLTSGLNRHLTAWKSWDDPSSGTLTYGYFKTEIPELEIRNDSTILFRSGPWNGIQNSGRHSVTNRQLFNMDFVSKKDEFYFQYKPRDPSLIAMSVINQTLNAFQRFILNEGNRTWKLRSNTPRDICDNYEHCGSFGSCAMENESAVCECLSGFAPKSPQNWTANNWSQGCVRSEPWSCKERGKDGFTKLQNVKVPDTSTSWYNTSMTLEECRVKCWENCSCTAYINSDISGEGSGCILWFGDLLDLRQLPDAGQDLYVRLTASETVLYQAQGKANDGSKKMVVVVAITVTAIVLILLTLMLIWWRRKFEVRGFFMMKVEKKNDGDQEDSELPLFDFNTVAATTGNFSEDKKLGEGGFGPVYKGTLPDGQDVAVKRLSHSSTQGMIEFKNEVIFCSKFQHRNLVKVLGCCIEEQEKLLIYEYMPNKSLDFFLFDSCQSKFLDWSKRFNIISGVARGLLYLHQDSRFRVIHRDLKASNVLLDDNMNPKISDFGLARMCGGDQLEGSTSRVVGTYGYMAPEYAIDGIFSIKSDVYSFGILILEILSGKKNKGLSYSNHSCNLVGHAWRLWKECTPVALIDTCLEDSYILSETLRCIHIGLLCVQHQPDDRPTMASVLIMLNSENALPQPKEPIFFSEKVSVKDKSTSDSMTSSSVNEVTVSIMEPR